ILITGMCFAFPIGRVPTGIRYGAQVALSSPRLTWMRDSDWALCPAGVPFTTTHTHTHTPTPHNNLHTHTHTHTPPHPPTHFPFPHRGRASRTHITNQRRAAAPEAKFCLNKWRT